MKIGCMYCEYGYDIAPPEGILEVLSDPSLPDEDHTLWVERFVKTIGVAEYQGIAIHTGMMHRGKQIGYNILFNDEERKMIERDTARTNTARPSNS